MAVAGMQPRDRLETHPCAEFADEVVERGVPRYPVRPIAGRVEMPTVLMIVYRFGHRGDDPHPVDPEPRIDVAQLEAAHHMLVIPYQAAQDAIDFGDDPLSVYCSDALAGCHQIADCPRGDECPLPRRPQHPFFCEPADGAWYAGIGFGGAAGEGGAP